MLNFQRALGCRSAAIEPGQVTGLMDSSVDHVRGMIIDTLRMSLGKPVELTESTNIVNDLGLDSVEVMDFVMEIEDRLDISVPLDRIAEIETIGDLVLAIRNLKENA
jgi:acyl carrier protein